MNAEDYLTLIHPTLAVTVIFPMLGMVLYYAWQTRQRRLQNKKTDKTKSNIPVSVGKEHVLGGKWLSSGVVGITLLGVAQPIGRHIIEKEVFSKNPFQVIFIILMFGLTIASLVFLHRSREKLWRAIFATLTGMGVVILGLQDGVYRLLNQWYVSHYVIGTTVALLMIFSLAIIPEIYRDPNAKTWRTVHISLNSFALLLFIGQGWTGTRDLLEIPLSWQKPTIYGCDFKNNTCPPFAPQPPAPKL